MVQETSRNAKTQPLYLPGDILTVQVEHGKFAVMKILAMDAARLHGLIYAQRFEERPRSIDINKLSIGSFVTLDCDHFDLSKPESIKTTQ